MLSVQAALQLGDLLYDSHVITLRLRRARLPVVDRLEVSLPAGLTFSAVPGDEVALDLDSGDVDGAGGSTRVFTGLLTQVERTLQGFRLQAHGHGLLLARYRPSATMENVTVGDVIQTLCDDAEVETGQLEAGPTLALYAAEGRATALQEIARLAWLAGVQAVFDGEGALHATTGSGSAQDHALRYGRELVGLSVGAALPDQTQLAFIGEGAGDPGSPDGRTFVTDFAKGGAPSPGPRTRRRPQPELRTVDAARTAATAWMERRAAREAPVRLDTWLLPVLAPGARVELSDVPEHLGLSECRVVQVVHQLDAARGARSRIWATGKVDAGGLLGGLAGAVGGLL